MGSLSDNLLKLTEFPFSYSFIGLLALIFGEGLNFGGEEFFNKIGPLLIVMGFVATTLSITDPIGALQKDVWLRGLRSESIQSMERREHGGYSLEEFLSLRFFGMNINSYFIDHATIAAPFFI